MIVLQKILNAKRASKVSSLNSHEFAIAMSEDDWKLLDKELRSLFVQDDQSATTICSMFGKEIHRPGPVEVFLLSKIQ